MPPFVSVIIPVYNDEQRLRLCLQALENQTYPVDSYEVVVVDNGSLKSIEPLLLSFPHTTGATEHQPGSYYARNKGIEIAKGNILAFTDSDCIPSSVWIEKGVEALSNTTNCGLVGGRVDVFPLDSSHPTAVEVYEILKAFEQKKLIQRSRFAVTANLFTFRHVINHVGNWKGELMSGGDMEWCWRVDAAGYKLVYADEAAISHPARRTLQDIWYRYVRDEGSRYDLYQKANWSTPRFVWDVFKNMLPNPIYLFQLFMDNRLKGFKQRFQVIAIDIYIRYVHAVTAIGRRRGREALR